MHLAYVSKQFFSVCQVDHPPFKLLEGAEYEDYFEQLARKEMIQHGVISIDAKRR